jgi:hypothetical protein
MLLARGRDPLFWRGISLEDGIVEEYARARRVRFFFFDLLSNPPLLMLRRRRRRRRRRRGM